MSGRLQQPKIVCYFHSSSTLLWLVSWTTSHRRVGLVSMACARPTRTTHLCTPCSSSTAGTPSLNMSTSSSKLPSRSHTKRRPKWLITLQRLMCPPCGWSCNTNVYRCFTSPLPPQSNSANRSRISNSPEPGRPMMSDGGERRSAATLAVAATWLAAEW